MNRRGFTLVELLAAASLFLAAVLSFSYLLKTGASSIEAAGRLNRAVYALQAKNEEIHTLSFSELPSLNKTTFEKGAGKVLITPALADLVKIELELEWDSKKAPLRLCTLRSKYQ